MRTNGGPLSLRIPKGHVPFKNCKAKVFAINVIHKLNRRLIKKLEKDNQDVAFLSPEVRHFILKVMFKQHRERYNFFRKLAANKVCLDIASGEGYGTDMLAKEARFVYGVDINKEAIEHARHKYSKKNLEFHHITNRVNFPEEYFDIVYSFETIEQVNSPERFLYQIYEVLKPGGLFIISTPNAKVYEKLVGRKKAITHCNSEMDTSEFRDVVKHQFRIRKHFKQIVFNKKSPFAYVRGIYSWFLDYRIYEHEELSGAYNIMLCNK